MHFYLTTYSKQDVEIWNEYTYNTSGQITRKVSHEYYDKSELDYKDYTYNTDGTIKSIHVSYSWKTNQSDLHYTYTSY